jgi:phosphoglucosamine mutase
MRRQKTLRKDTVVATVMSNMGLEKVLSKTNINLIRTQVGDRYVVEEMRNRGFNFGGEQSGHLIFMDHNTTGDGILSALQILAVITSEEKPLSELAAVMEIFPQILLNTPVKKKIPLTEVPVLNQQIETVKKMMKSRGRLLVRYSGTENKLRVMLEGENFDEIKKYAEELSDSVKNILG